VISWRNKTGALRSVIGSVHHREVWNRGTEIVEACFASCPNRDFAKMPECGANAMLDTTCQRFLLEGCFGFQDRVDMAGSSLQLCKASPGVGRVRSGLIGSDRVTIEQALHLINIAASMWKGALVHIDLVKRPRRSYTLLFLWIFAGDTGEFQN